MNARFLRHVVAPIGLVVLAHAQTPRADDASNLAATNQQPVALEAFTVDTSRDRGYIAVDSLAGGRSNTPIKLTPSVMSSLTRTFIDDVGINNVRDALRWTPNVVPSDFAAGKASPFNAWDYNFRGAGQSLQGGSGPGRNYFTFYQVADSYNVERIEADRGPNSILFGVGTVGGVLTTYTKAPRMDKDFAVGTLQVDDLGSLRFELDANYNLLPNKLAVRVNAVDDHNRGWRENDKNDFQGIDVAFLFKPTSRTTFRLELEGARAERTIISESFGESVSLWDGTTVAPTWGSTLDTADPQATPGAPGVRRMHPWGGSTYNLWVAGQGNLGLQDWGQGYSSNGTFLRVAPEAGFYPSTMQASFQPNPHPNPGRMPVLPSRDFTLSAADGISKPEYENLTAWLDQKITENVDAQVSFYRYTDNTTAQNYEPVAFYAVDINRQLPSGQTNPNFGKAYGDFFASRQVQKREVTEGRAQLNFHFDGQIGSIPYKQLLSVAAGKQKITWGSRQYMAQVLNGNSGDAATNMVWVRLYEDTPNASVSLPGTIDGKTVGYAPWSSNWFDFDEQYDLENVSAVSHTRLWDDRLSILLGARRDKYEYHRVDAFTHAETASEASGTTYSAGAIYYFGWLGVFGNYSKNFDPIGPGRSPQLNGTVQEAAEGEGTEFGVRISTNDGRYYASISRYDSESSGRISSSKIDLAGIWRNYFVAAGLPDDPARSRLSYDDTEALKLSGYEIEVTANPTSRLRLQLAFAKPESEVVEALPAARAYFASNLATWQAAANGSSTAAGDLRNLLNTSQTVLDSNLAGQTKTGLVDYTASGFANYTFNEGLLKGFSIGGGVAQTGKQYVTSIRGVQYFADERTTTSLVLAYETTWRKVGVRLALNVENVLGDEDYVLTSYDSAWSSNGTPIASGYNLPAPRLFRLTARFSF